MWLPTKEEQLKQTPSSHLQYVCIKKMKYNMKKFFIFFFLSMLTITALTFIYFYIEHCYDPQQQEVNEDTWQLCQYFLSQQQQQQQHNNHTNINITRLIDICEGVEPPTRIECELTQTNFFKYFDLTSTMAYTVGYGHVTPKSRAGKILTIIVVLPLIALVMTSYVYAGEVITSLTYITVLQIRQRVFNMYSERHFIQQAILFQFNFMIFLWVGLSAVDQHINSNNRTFLDSLYFGMVTISTVGFGDFSWSSEQCYRVGLHFLIFSMIAFVFSMGTFASSITQISSLVAAYSKRGIKKQQVLQKSIHNLTDNQLSKSHQVDEKNKTSWKNDNEQRQRRSSI